MNTDVKFSDRETAGFGLIDYIALTNNAIKSYAGDRVGYFKLDWGDITYYCKQDTEDKETYIIYDVVVRHDKSSLDFFMSIDEMGRRCDKIDTLLPNCKHVKIDIADNGRTYPPVQTLSIGEAVNGIHIRNSQFPAVNSIRTPRDNSAFAVIDDTVLVETIDGRNIYYKLLNMLGSGSGSTDNGFRSYSLSRVREIADYAFCGTYAAYGIFTRCCERVAFHEHSFDGNEAFSYDENGIMSAEGFIIDVRPDVSCVEIGNARYNFVNSYLIETGKIKKIIIDTYRFPQNEIKLAYDISALVKKAKGKADVILNITNPLTNVTDRFMTELPEFTDAISTYPGYIRKEGVIYTNDMKKVIYARNAPENAVISDGACEISTAAFAHSRVKTVSLPSTLKKIDNSAFFYASSLTSISLPEGLCNIGEAAFKGSGIREITLPKTLRTAEDGAFEGCNIIRSYPGTGMPSITRFFKESDICYVLLLEDAKAGTRYAFVPSRFINFSSCYSTTKQDFFEAMDSAWESGDMDSFKDLANSYISQISPKYKYLHEEAAIRAFMSGYADETVERYAKTHAADFVGGCIIDNNEKLAIEVINVPGLVSKPSLKKLLPLLVEAEMSEASAIVSERTVPKIKRVISI